MLKRFSDRAVEIIVSNCEWRIYNEGKMIKVDLEDKDFTFILNPSEGFIASNMEIRELMGL